jgi:hypothetical protein
MQAFRLPERRIANTQLHHAERDNDIARPHAPTFRHRYSLGGYSFNGARRRFAVPYVLSGIDGREADRVPATAGLSAVW